MEEQQGLRGTIEGFIENWQRTEPAMAGCFARFYQILAEMDGVCLQFLARPGVSYSLRPWRENAACREFFAIVDVIDDDPDERWLSVCFYRDMIADPQELGESIPGGLGGHDGYCFDLSRAEDEMVAYLGERLGEAYRAAAG